MTTLPPVLSVVIVSVDTAVWLRGCLESLARQELDGQLQIVVVDNACSDDTTPMVRDDWPGCSLVALDERVGFGEANNVGARECRAPVLLFLNPDTVVEDGSLANVLKGFDDLPQSTIVGGRILDGEGELERSKGSYPTVCSLAVDRLLARLSLARPWLGRMAHQHWTGYDQRQEVDWVTGAYLWIRRRVFEGLGGFDPRIFMYAEDMELCYRVRQSGGQCWYLPCGPIVHFRNKAPTTRSRTRMRRQSLAYFAGKHYRTAGKGPSRAVFHLLGKL